MRILIVGGGLAGLTLAIALKDSPHDVELIERVPAWGNAGSGIGIGPNAMFALRSIGIPSEAVAAAGYPFETWEIYGDNDTLLHRYDFSSAVKHFGFRAVSIHRATLQTILLESAEGIPIRLGTVPTAMAQVDRGVQVEMSDGSETYFDLVVGADGLNSAVRTMVFSNVPITYSGHTSFRCVVERLPGLDCLVEIWSDGKRVGMAPINGRQSYCYASLAAPPSRSFEAEADFDLFKREFQNIGGHFPRIFEQVTRPGHLIRTDLTELVNQDWLSGRVLLIGDAAHAMTPELGQGGAMAIEDAVALARHIRDARTFEEALTAMVDERRPIAASIQVRSRLFGMLVHLRGPNGESLLRDELVRNYGYAMMNSLVFGPSTITELTKLGLSAKPVVV